MTKPSHESEQAGALDAHLDHPGWRAYLNGRMLICVFLGFTSGLPLFTLLSLVQAWLHSAGVNIKEIGLFSLIMIPYTWKFVWSPLMDRFVPHLGFWRPGRRRGWMLLTQVLVAGSIATLGFVSPSHSIWTVAALTFVVALFGASSDIVIDAYRRELLHDTEQGLGNAIHVNAYKIAGLVPGSLALILSDHLPWTLVFMITAAFMVPGMIMTLLVKEPALYGDPPHSLRDAVVLPFVEFLRREGWHGVLLVLGFIFLYKLGDTMATSMATPFFLDIGFTKTEIGIVAKAVAFWASIAGGLLGGVALVRLGIMRGLLIFGVMQIFATLGFAWLAKAGPSLSMMGMAYGFETFCTGLSLAAFTAFIASTTDPRYTATQFALFTSLAAVPRTFATAATGYIVTRIGWFDYLLICAALGVPGLLLLSKVSHHVHRRTAIAAAAG